MQERFADDGVTIIGVTREDSSNTLEAVRKMTAEKGDTMAYTVAWDDEGQTYADYMTASDSHGIPTSFLVDREGKIAFIGHPGYMDMPMAMVVNGTWDAVEGPAMMAEMRKAQSEIITGARNPDKKSAEQLLTKLDAFGKAYPTEAGSLDSLRYGLLVAAERTEEAAAEGRKVVAAAIKVGDSNALNAIAWGIVDPAVELSSRDLGLALYAATVASNLKKNADPAILDTLARAHFLMGGIDRAIELQELAVELATGRMAESLQEALDEYLGAKKPSKSTR